MPCQNLLRGLSDYLDGETQSALCQSLREHLADCPTCRIVVDNLRQTITLYKAGVESPLPSDVHQTLRSALLDRWAAKYSK